MKTNYLIRGFLLSTALQLFANVAIAETGPMSLSDCLKFGMEHSPVVKQYQGFTESADAGIAGARAAKRLHMGAEVAWWHHRSEFNSFENISRNGIGDTYQSTSASVWLRTVLSDFGRTDSKVNAAKSNLASKRKDLEWVRIQVAGGIKLAYFQVRKARVIMQLREESLAQTEKELERINELRSVGGSSIYDRSKVALAVSTAKMDLSTAKADYEQARAGLARAMGLNDSLEIKDESFQIADVRAISRKDCENMALNRPDLVSARFQIDQAKYLAQESARGNRPTLAAEGYAYNGLRSPYEKEWNVGIVLEFPIFDGGERRAERRERLGALKTAEGVYEQLVNDVYAELNGSFAELEGNNDKLSIAQEYVDQSQANLDIAVERYDSGAGNFLDVADAQKAYLSARENYEKSYHDLLGSLTRIDAITGMTPTN